MYIVNIGLVTNNNNTCTLSLSYAHWPKSVMLNYMFLIWFKSEFVDLLHVYPQAVTMLCTASS